MRCPRMSSTPCFGTARYCSHNHSNPFHSSSQVLFPARRTNLRMQGIRYSVSLAQYKDILVESRRMWHIEHCQEESLLRTVCYIQCICVHLMTDSALQIKCKGMRYVSLCTLSIVQEPGEHKTHNKPGS